MRGGRDLLGLGDVEPQGLDAGQGHGGGIARGGVDLAGATGQQFARKGQADAAVGSRDQDNGVFNVHGKLRKSEGLNFI
ncbi:hypothetical protein FQZ97_1042610 [compost metagenome]